MSEFDCKPECAELRDDAFRRVQVGRGDLAPLTRPAETTDLIRAASWRSR